MTKFSQEPWEDGNVTPILHMKKLRQLPGSIQEIKTKARTSSPAISVAKKGNLILVGLGPPTGVPPGGNSDLGFRNLTLRASQALRVGPEKALHGEQAFQVIPVQPGRVKFWPFLPHACPSHLSYAFKP